MLSALIAGTLLISVALAEDTSITTYYPAPAGGSATASKVRKQAIGSNAYWTALDSAADGTLIVQGSVGIGTTTPGSRLSIIDLSSSVETLHVENRSNAAMAWPLWLAGGANDGTAKTVTLHIQGNALQASTTAVGRFVVGHEGASSSSPASYLSIWTRAGSGLVSERLRVASTGDVGIGTTTPTSALDLNGALTLRGMAAPAAAPAGQGRIYFDSTANRMRVSENGGAYQSLGGSAPDYDSGWVGDTIDGVGNHRTIFNHNLAVHPRRIELWFRPKPIPSEEAFPGSIYPVSLAWYAGPHNPAAVRVTTTQIILSIYVSTYLYSAWDPVTDWRYWRKGDWRVYAWQ